MNTHPTFNTIDKKVFGAMGKPGKLYWFFLALSALAFVTGLGVWGHQIINGMGVAGITHPVGWEFISPTLYSGSVLHTQEL